MSLLVLNRVSKRYQRGGREEVALSEVCLEVDAGEMVGIVGRRRSGRTTLLLVAAGVEPPTEGLVTFDGMPLADCDLLGARGGISLCTTIFPAAVGRTVVEQVAAPLMSRGARATSAHARAHELLRRVGAAATIALDPWGLDPTEALRVGLARALATEPRLVLVDDPVLGVRLAERDDILELLASIAHKDGVAILMAVDGATELAGCDRAAQLDAGALRGETTRSSAPVIPFKRRSAPPA